MGIFAVVNAPHNNIEYTVIEATNLWQWLSFLGGFHQSSRGLYEMYSDNPSTIRVCVLCLPRTTTANLMKSWLTPDENQEKNIESHLGISWQRIKSVKSSVTRLGWSKTKKKAQTLCYLRSLKD